VGVHLVSRLPACLCVCVPTLRDVLLCTRETKVRDTEGWLAGWLAGFLTAAGFSIFEAALEGGTSRRGLRHWNMIPRQSHLAGPWVKRGAKTTAS